MRAAGTTRSESVLTATELDAMTNEIVLAEVCRQRIAENLDFQFETGHVKEEFFMLTMLEHGLVGMDGFKYCWPEIAKANRRLTLVSKQS